MISKTDVVFTLTKLEVLFDNAILSPLTYPEANYFGKLAVIEASSWLEECVEDMCESLASTNLTVGENTKAFDTFKKNNHGFNYEKYFRNNLLLKIIGLVNIEKLELLIGSTQKFQEMKAALNSLAVLRGGFAHAHLTETTALSVQSVRDTIRLFNQSVTGLTEIEKQLKKIKFK